MSLLPYENVPEIAHYDISVESHCVNFHFLVGVPQAFAEKTYFYVTTMLLRGAFVVAIR